MNNSVKNISKKTVFIVVGICLIFGGSLYGLNYPSYDDIGVYTDIQEDLPGKIIIPGKNGEADVLYSLSWRNGQEFWDIYYENPKYSDYAYPKSKTDYLTGVAFNKEKGYYVVLKIKDGQTEELMVNNNKINTPAFLDEENTVFYVEEEKTQLSGGKYQKTEKKGILYKYNRDTQQKKRLVPFFISLENDIVVCSDETVIFVPQIQKGLEKDGIPRVISPLLAVKKDGEIIGLCDDVELMTSYVDDASVLVYIKKDGLYIVKLCSGEKERVTKKFMDVEKHFAVSPDGKYAFGVYYKYKEQDFYLLKHEEPNYAANLWILGTNKRVVVQGIKTVGISGIRKGFTWMH